MTRLRAYIWIFGGAVVILLMGVGFYFRLAPVSPPAPEAIMSESLLEEPGRITRKSYTTDEERRQRVVAAAWRVICRDGITAASLRTIAKEMGATAGLVTRYFPEKQGLMLAALQQAAGMLSREVETAAAAHTGMARVEAAVLGALPVMQPRFLAWQVWVAFMAELPGDPDLGVAHNVFPDRLRQILIQGLREAQLEGRIASQAHTPQLADMLLNQIIGVGVRAVNAPQRYPANRLPGLIAPFFAQMVRQ